MKSLRDFIKRRSKFLGSAMLANALAFGGIALEGEHGKYLSHIDRNTSSFAQGKQTTPMDGHSIYYLAVRYERGEGVRRNYRIARALYQTASDAGCREGAFAIGRMFALGEGVPVSSYRARWWYRNGEREPRSCL
jgi:TPR repeat protein